MKDNTKNKLIDLNNHLFCLLERLNEEDGEGMKLWGEGLRDELNRAAAMCKIAETIIENGRLIVDAAKTVDHAMGKIKLPLLLSGGNEA